MAFGKGCCYTGVVLLTRFYRRLSAWLALVALLFGALAPTVTQAVVMGSDRADWLEICSVSGMVWVQADTGEVREVAPEGGAPLHSDASPHCPWCTLHGGATGLPVSHGLPDQPRAADVPPQAQRFVPLTKAVWVHAQSRAPPSF